MLGILVPEQEGVLSGVTVRVPPGHRQPEETCWMSCVQEPECEKRCYGSGSYRSQSAGGSEDVCLHDGSKKKCIYEVGGQIWCLQV